MTPLRLNKPFVAAALLAGTLALGGCLAHDPFDAPIDQGSAAAERVDAATARSRPYPKWSEFPSAPTNVPQPSQFAARVQDVEAAEAELVRAAAGIEWTLSGTEEWAAAARALVDPDLSAPVSAQEAADSEAFARALRERANPPPVAK